MRAVLAAFAIASALSFASNALAAAASSAESGSTAVLTETEQRQRDREKLLGLEERFERQRQEAQATQQALSAMQAKLREAEQARANDPAIYGLMTIIVALLITVAVLVVRLSRAQSQRRWVDEARTLKEDLSPAPVPSSQQRTVPQSITPPLNEATMTSMRVLAEPPADAVSQTTVPAPRVRRELTAEELIDLEQQADFFIALGEEDQAIDLLMSHVRSSGGTSPMPYLKLLGIFHGRSDADAYERMRERFNRRFNSFAPAWDSYGKQTRTLESYEPEFKRVVAAWSTPSQTVGLLQTLLYRRDASTEVFELPAYGELLFLYAVARDVLEHMTNPDGVDLLLPLGKDHEEPPIMHYEVTRPPESWMPKADIELDIKSPPSST
jgi:pilus assembly protein FimV